jgi:hypothetical protein
MKKENIQQEILIMTETTLLSEELLENKNLGNSTPLTEKEKLVEACWNGLLYSLIPFIFDQPAKGERLYLWEIKEASHFLELEFGRFEEARDAHFSIDPYYFLEIIPFN